MNKQELREQITLAFMRTTGLPTREKGEENIEYHTTTGLEHFLDSAMQLIEAYTADIEREASKRVGDWATSDDTGTSSKALMRHMLGLGPNRWGFMPPSDASDRGRCIRLLNKFPEWYDRLDEMAQYDGWAKQIELIRKENT